MSKASPWPLTGKLGLVLILIFWPLNWFLTGPRTHWGFFPLWLGYCLFIDTLTKRKVGSSLLSRNPRAYLGLFFLSSPIWWLFELINRRTKNWLYLGEEGFGSVGYFFFSTLNFSTVLPAVFGTAELVSTFSLIRNMRRNQELFNLPLRSPFLFFATGLLTVALFILWPRYFFPLVWISLYFLTEGINLNWGGRTLISPLAKGDPRPLVSLGIGTLICGFFWELWNYYSYPKWVYQLPFFDFLRLFEMPLLGYLGYIPFSWELFGIYHFLLSCSGFRHLEGYLKLPPDNNN